MKRNRIVLILSVIGSIVFISFNGTSTSYAILWFALLFPAVLFGYTYYVYLHFKVYQNIERKTVVKGERIPFNFILANEDYVTFTNIRVAFKSDVATVDDVDPDEEYCLLPGEKISKSTTLCCKYRGEYKVGVHSVTVTDFLKVFTISYPTLTVINMRVFPRVVDINNPSFIPEINDVKNVSCAPPRKQDYLDIDMRKYISGDSMRIIHWKTSAKRNELISRKYSDELRTEAVMILDLSKSKEKDARKLAVEDKVLETVLSIVKYYVKIKEPLRLIYFDGKLKNIVIKNKADFDLFYNRCVDIKFSSSIALSEIIRAIPSYFNSQAFTMIATCNFTEDMCNVCATLIQAYSAVTLLNVCDKFDPEKYDLNPKVNTIPIDLNDEIDQVLNKT